MKERNISMYNWKNPKDRESAFTQAIERAMTHEDVKKALLDPSTAKSTLESQEVGDIQLPKEMEVVFYRQEDLDMRLVMVIPGRPTPPHQSEIEPGFVSCMKCTWITYRQESEEGERLRTLGKQSETRYP